jgi:hypothetical protein
LKNGVSGPLRIMPMNPISYKMLAWMVLAVLTALLAWGLFRGYLSPELLLGFANSFSC